jgi:putative ATPase
VEQLNLFNDIPSTKPLAEKYRPQSFEDLIGSVKKNQNFINWFNSTKNQQKFISILLWGPPGSGKTTIAELFAKNSGRVFLKLQAFNSGVKELREAIDTLSRQPKPGILFVDELHNFSKNQQDALLNAIELGKIVFIGATTENPAIAINKALLSRLIKFELKAHSFADLNQLMDRVSVEESIVIEEAARDYLVKTSAGDARMLLNAIEACLLSFQKGENIKSKSNDRSLLRDYEAGENPGDRVQEQSLNVITFNLCQELIQRQVFSGDADSYYSCVSALQKAMRGSDPNASIYWLARLLEGGADLKAVARRILVTASEDVGLADNNALVIAEAAYRAALELGMPEARIPLAQAVIYIASAKKSNKAYKAINLAMQDCKNFEKYPVPFHLRPLNFACPAKSDNVGVNPITDYKYPHDYEGAYVEQEYLPFELKDRVYFDF